MYLITLKRLELTNRSTFYVIDENVIVDESNESVYDVLTRGKRLPVSTKQFARSVCGFISTLKDVSNDIFFMA